MSDDAMLHALGVFQTAIKPATDAFSPVQQAQLLALAACDALFKMDKAEADRLRQVLVRMFERLNFEDNAGPEKAN